MTTTRLTSQGEVLEPSRTLPIAHDCDVAVVGGGTAGGTTRDVTRTTVYLTDLANYAGMNEVYRTYFPAEPPARATVRVDLVNADFLVEIEATAVIS